MAKANEVQGFVKGQLTVAQKRLVAFEAEADKVLKNLIAQGQNSRKDLDSLIARLGSAELKIVNGTLNDLAKRAKAVLQEARKKLEEFQSRALEVAGVASQDQVKTLSRQLSKLSRRMDTLTEKGDARA